MADGVLRLALSGEIDLRRQEELRLLAEAYERGDLPSVHLDLSEVPFLDSSGLAFLARLARASAARGGEVVVSGAHPIVERVLEVSGLLAVVRLQP